MAFRWPGPSHLFATQHYWHSWQCPRIKTSVILPTEAIDFIEDFGNSNLCRQVTLPQSTQMKCGCSHPSGCESSRNSKRQTWSPSSFRVTSPASTRSVRFRKTVALSKPSGTRLAAMSACVAGDFARPSQCITAKRAAVVLNPRSDKSSRVLATASASDRCDMFNRSCCRRLSLNIPVPAYILAARDGKSMVRIDHCHQSGCGASHS